MKLKRSRVLLSAIASALKVEVTTLGIRFELQAIGQTTALSLRAKCLLVEKIRVPCLEDKFVAVENEASENAQKVNSSTGIGTISKRHGDASLHRELDFLPVDL
jgi:hypothetical protein